MYNYTLIIHYTSMRPKTLHVGKNAEFAFAILMSTMAPYEDMISYYTIHQCRRRPDIDKHDRKNV